MTKEQRERLDQASDILLSVFWDIRDDPKCKAEAKRLDTILGKLDNLIYMELDKELNRG